MDSPFNTLAIISGITSPQTLIGIIPDFSEEDKTRYSSTNITAYGLNPITEQFLKSTELYRTWQRVYRFDLAYPENELEDKVLKDITVKVNEYIDGGTQRISQLAGILLSVTEADFIRKSVTKRVHFIFQELVKPFMCILYTYSNCTSPQEFKYKIERARHIENHYFTQRKPEDIIDEEFDFIASLSKQFESESEDDLTHLELACQEMDASSGHLVKYFSFCKDVFSHRLIQNEGELISFIRLKQIPLFFGPTNTLNLNVLVVHVLEQVKNDTMVQRKQLSDFILFMTFKKLELCLPSLIKEKIFPILRNDGVNVGMLSHVDVSIIDHLRRVHLKNLVFRLMALITPQISGQVLLRHFDKFYKESNKLTMESVGAIKRRRNV